LDKGGGKDRKVQERETKAKGGEQIYSDGGESGGCAGESYVKKKA